jgi:Holliday junction DNA helicase RuvA
MIASLQGILIHKSPEHLIINVNGVGYQVHVSLTTFCELPDLHQEVLLNIYTHVREDCIHLFGFISLQEKEMFMRLIEVAGIGPRLAVNILSGITAEDLRSAIWAGDITRLNSIRGVGKKIAERIVIELRDKLKADMIRIEPDSGSIKGAEQMMRDALSALLNLGYRPKEAEEAVKRAFQQVTETPPTLGNVIRDALRLLG